MTCGSARPKPRTSWRTASRRTSWPASYCTILTCTAHDGKSGECFHDPARDEELDELRVELRSRLTPQDLLALVHRDRLLVRTIGGHGVVGVAETDDARQ